MTRLSFTVCAYCGQDHELVSAITAKGELREPRPNDGDVTICFACGQWNVFDDGSEGGLRKATDAEIKRLMKNKIWREVAEAWRRAEQDRQRGRAS